MPSPLSFETKRLILTPTKVEDAAFILQLYNCPTWIRFIGDRNIKTLESAKKYIQERMLPQQHRLGYSSYTISRKRDNIKIGTCSLYDRDTLEDIDIGFALLPEYEHQGYALEATLQLREVAFKIFGIKTLCAITSFNNLSSQRLLEKLGMTTSETIKLPDEEEELLLYKISLV